MKLKLFIITTAALTSIAVLAEDNGAFYQNALSSNEMVLVYRKEVSRSGTLKTDAEKLIKLREHRPEAHLVPVQNVFEFKLFYREDKQPEKMVWSKTFNYRDRGPAIPSQFKFLDTCKRNGDLYLLYKEGPETYIQKITGVTSSNPQADAPALLFTDSPAFGKVTTAGAFGTNDGTNLVLQINYANGKSGAWTSTGNQWVGGTNSPVR